jgi:hypothetical protein
MADKKFQIPCQHPAGCATTIAVSLEDLADGKMLKCPRGHAFALAADPAVKRMQQARIAANSEIDDLDAGQQP